MVRHQVDRNDGDHQGHTGEQADPVLAREHVVKSVGDQQAQRRLGDRQAQAEEGEGGFQGDGGGHLHRRDNDQRRQAVGQQVAEHNARSGQGQHLRGLDVFAAPLDHRRAAHGARVVSPLHGDQRDDDLAGALPEQGQQHQGDQNRREGELDVGNAHQHAIGTPAHVGGQHADHRADQQGDEGGRGAHQQRDAQAVEDAGEHVAALVIRTEDRRLAVAQLRARFQARVHDVQLRQVIRVLRRDPRREDGDEQHHQQHQRAQHGQAAGAKVADEAFEGGLFHTCFGQFARPGFCLVRIPWLFGSGSVCIDEAAHRHRRGEQNAVEKAHEAERPGMFGLAAPGGVEAHDHSAGQRRADQHRQAHIHRAGVGMRHDQQRDPGQAAAGDEI